MVKRTAGCILGALVLAFVHLVAPPSADGQKAEGKGDANAERSRALREAMEALEAARIRNTEGLGVESIRRAATSDEAKKLREQATGALKRQMGQRGSEELVKRAAQEEILRRAKAGATPEASALIKASASTPPSPGRVEKPVLVAQNTAPPRPGGGNVSEPVPVNPSTVKVPPREVRDTKTKPEPKGKVVITADDAAFFDANNKIAIFKGNVEVDHPTFDLSCDTLEVFFKDSEAAPGKKEDAPATEGGGVPAGGEGVRRDGAGEIDKVVATGKQVVIQKMSAKNQLQIGKCRKAIFHGGSGQVEMLIWPQVQQGKYLIISRAEGTRMVFSQNGEMQTFGETESTFVKDDGKKDKKDPVPGTPPPTLDSR